MKYITSTPGVIGGDPAIVGTRISIEIVLIRLRQGHTIKEIHETYPWFPMKNLKGAISEITNHVVKSLHA